MNCEARSNLMTQAIVWVANDEVNKNETHYWVRNGLYIHVKRLDAGDSKLDDRMPSIGDSTCRKMTKVMHKASSSLQEPVFSFMQISECQAEFFRDK